MLMFVVKHYARKVWPTHERRSAQARALREAREYILPARFDNTEVPGLRETVGYVDLHHKTPEQLAELVSEKLIQSGAEIRVPSTPAPSSGVTGERPAAVTHLNVSVKAEEGDPVEGAHVLLVAASGTYQQRSTDGAGDAKFAIPRRRLLTAFCAHKVFPAHIERDFDPVEDLTIILPKVESTGSIACPEGTGYVPGLEGRLNPIRDTSNLLYLYADYIAIREGGRQPAKFELGVPFEVEDRNGNVFDLKIIEVIGRSSLIESSER
jgi:hypothetical protein